MKIFTRLILLAVALAIGSGLGYLLLLDSDPVKISLFAIACPIIGNVLHEIDKRIFNGR